MKRIDIRHGGTTYSVRDRDLAELQKISAALTSGQPHWLQVNEGEGTPRTALLFLSPGMNLALLPLPEPPADVDPSTHLPPEPAR
jgi:hypothetical protein